MMRFVEHAETLGEFIRLGGRMQGLCIRCNGTEKFEIDLAAVVRELGEDCLMQNFMIMQKCQHCGRRLSLYEVSSAPAEKAG